MINSLFTLRPSDGRILKCVSGGVWTEDGAVQGTNPPIDAPSVWFRLLGTLYCSFNAQDLVIVASYANGDLVPVASTTSLPFNVSWGAPVTLGQSIVWFERDSSGGTSRFTFDGTTLVKTSVTGLPGIEAGNFIPSMESVSVVSLDRSLVSVPRNIALDAANGSCKSHARDSLIDLTTDEASKVFFGSTDSFTTTMPDGSNELSNMVIAAGVFKDELYGIYGDGQFCQINPSTGVRNPIADIRTIEAGKSSACRNGSDSAQLVCNNLTPIMPFLLGAKVTVTSGNYVGRTGTVSRIVGTVQPEFTITTDGDPFPALPIYTEVTFTFGFAGGICSDVYIPCSAGGLHHTFFLETEDQLTIFMLGRSPLYGSPISKATTPTIMITYDGLRPTVKQLPSISAFAAAAALDAEINCGHLLYLDGVESAVHHLRINLATGHIDDFGTIYDVPEYNPNTSSLTQGSFVQFNSEEVDAAIFDVHVNSNNGTADVYYNTSRTATVQIEYNAGDGWKLATPTDTQTDGIFQHALRVDLPDFHGDMQYRISTSHA
jgi:hypothetical protein